MGAARGSRAPSPTRSSLRSTRSGGVAGVIRRALLLVTLAVLAYGYVPIAIGYDAATRELAAVQAEIAGLQTVVADLEERLDPQDGSFSHGR